MSLANVITCLTSSEPTLDLDRLHQHTRLPSTQMVDRVNRALTTFLTLFPTYLEGAVQLDQ